MRFWKKPLLYFTSILGCLSTGIFVVIACSGEPDPYDYYTSFFNPSIQGEKEYGSFYFTDYNFTYDTAEPESEAAINAKEWASYLGAPVKAADVERIMYHLDSAGRDRAYHFFDQDPPMADSLSASKFLWTLKQPKYDAARKYYQFAVKVESLNISDYNYWEPAPIDTSGLTSAANEALEAANAETDPYIKLRYYYQAQKLNHYAERYEKARDIYAQHIEAVKSDSHVKGWALALKAGEDRRLGDTTQAAYLFSKVFGEYPERRLQAYRNYHYIGAPFDDVFKQAKTADEKANLYAIKSFANPEIETEKLEKVYQNKPTSPLVGVLLVREINKLEQYYLTPALSNNNNQFYSAATTSSAFINKSEPSKLRWPIWIGLAIVLAGIIIVILSVKKHSLKSPTGIAGSLFLVIGIGILVWYFYSNSSSSVEKGPKSQGSFFVSMPDSVKSKYDAHIEKLRSFCSNLVEESKYPEPQIGTLASAYLSFMQNKPKDGLSVLKKTDNQKLGNKLSDQKEILRLLLSAQNMKQIHSVDEASLLPSLVWLDKKVAEIGKPNTNNYPIKPHDHNQFAITQRNFYNQVLAPAYLRQGDTAKAALSMLVSRKGKAAEYSDYMYKSMPDFWFNYLHSSHLKQIIDWKAKRPTDPYLSFLSGTLNEVDEYSLFELLGTIQLREHDYEGALVSFRNEKTLSKPAGSGEEIESTGDPFMVLINDYDQPSTSSVTKLQFAQKMATLAAKLKKDPKNADTYFQMATGLYNTSTYSNSWSMISYEWSSYDYARKSMFYYDQDYIKTTTAKRYYLKARDLSKDQELKAMCTFMAAKCLQKENESPSYIYDYKTYEEREKAFLKELRQNSYFKELDQYKSTAFYRRAMDECSYFSDFIAAR